MMIMDNKGHTMVHRILLVYLAFSFVYETASSPSRSAIFRKDASMSGKRFTGLLLFEMLAHSPVQCGQVCHSTYACSAVSVTSSAPTSPVTCRGHGGPGQRLTIQSPSVADPETDFYERSCKVLSECSTWLYDDCTVDSDCGVVNTRCVTGQCVCRPDYYYSETADRCVDSCQAGDLQTNYLLYETMDFSGSDFDNHFCLSNMTYQECTQVCQTLCNAIAPSGSCVNALQYYLKCHFKHPFTANKSLTYLPNGTYMRRTCL